MNRGVLNRLVLALIGAALCAEARGQTVPIQEPNLTLVQQPPPTPQPPPIAPQDLGAGGAAEPQLPTDLRGPTNVPQASGQGSNTAPRAADTPAGSTETSISGGGGAAGAAVNAQDASDLLTKSSNTTGIDIQRRNTIVADARIRGLRSTQYNAWANNGLFIPSRLDLDSVISRFDPGTIRDVILIKGPYSALYGPGFAFLDIATLDSPRYDCREFHGRTGIGYSTNGQRWDGVQTLLVGDTDWGFRGTYNILQGNDYRAGDGTRVPSSYFANNVNFALGVDLSPVSSLEFKGLIVTQNDLEFPGLYFDIRTLSTQAYSARYTLVDQAAFDLLTVDFWYNATAATGDTQLRPKQAFVQALLSASFNEPTRQGQSIPGVTNTFTDASSTNFAGRSIGYRIATSWGPKNAPLLTVGTDMNVFGTALDEYIVFQQLSGVNINTGQLIPPGGPFPIFTQNQSIPPSNAVNPGLFAQGELQLTDALKVRAGGRYDYVHASSNPRLITGNIDLFGPPLNIVPIDVFDVDPIIYSSNPNNAALSREFNLGSAFLTTEYAVTDKITGLAAVGYAMRAPTLTELYASGPFIGVLQQGTSRLIGDPNLRPEKLIQVDIGLRADFEMFQGGINGFYAWINDYITFDANRLGEGLTQVVYTNTDRATLAGAELFGQFNATSWLTPFGTLSYVQGIDQTATDNRRAANLASSRRDAPLQGQRKAQTEPLPQIPPLEARLGVRIHDPNIAPRWQIEMSARMVSAQNLVATSLGELPTNGFTVVDIRTFYQVTDNWLVTFGVENVGDRFYREHLDFISGNLLGVGPLWRPGTNFYFGSQLTY